MKFGFTPSVFFAAVSLATFPAHFSIHARFHAAGHFNVLSNGAIASTGVAGSTGGITTYQVNLFSPPSTPLAVNPC